VGDRVIDVRRLRKSYVGVERLHGISFSVERGEIFGFLLTCRQSLAILNVA